MTGISTDGLMVLAILAAFAIACVPLVFYLFGMAVALLALPVALVVGIVRSALGLNDGQENWTVVNTPCLLDRFRPAFLAKSEAEQARYAEPMFMSRFYGDKRNGRHIGHAAWAEETETFIFLAHDPRTLAMRAPRETKEQMRIRWQEEHREKEQDRQERRERSRAAALRTWQKEWDASYDATR